MYHFYLFFIIMRSRDYGKNVATFTHPRDVQRLMCVASTVHAKAPGGSAVEGDFSGAHPASTDSTTSLTHASDFPASYLRVSRIAPNSDRCDSRWRHVQKS